MTQALIEALGLTVEMIKDSKRISIKTILERDCIWGDTADYSIDYARTSLFDDEPTFQETVRHYNTVAHASGELTYPAEGIFQLLGSNRFDLTKDTTATRWPIGAQSPVVLR